MLCFIVFRMLPLLSDSLLSHCLSRDWSLNTLSLITSLLTPLTRHSGVLKRLCSQSGKTYYYQFENFECQATTLTGMYFSCREISYYSNNFEFSQFQLSATWIREYNFLAFKCTSTYCCFVFFQTYFVGFLMK